MISVNVLIGSRFCKQQQQCGQVLSDLCAGLDQSFTARNYGHISLKQDINSGPNAISKSVKDKCYASVLDNDKRIGGDIQELIYLRNRQWRDPNLSHAEICDMTNFSATDC